MQPSSGLRIPSIRFELLNNLLLRNMLMTEFDKSKKDFESGGKNR